MIKRALLTVACAACAAAANAAPYSWIQWTGAGRTLAAGTITTDAGVVDVLFTGYYDGLVPGFPTWGPSSSYADGSIVDNAPDSNNIVELSEAGLYTLQFSKPVDHLAFAVWSVGNLDMPVTYTFDHSLTFIAGGTSDEYPGAGSAITTTSNSLTGSEGNGTVLFAGPMTSLTWTVDNAEYWHGFDVGLKTAKGTPEPATTTALVGGIVSLIARRHRKA